MNSHQNGKYRDMFQKNSHIQSNVSDNDNRVLARKRSFDSDPGQQGLLKKLKQAYDICLKALITPDVDGIVDTTACTQASIPTVSDDEIALSDLAILTSSGKVPMNLKASDLLDVGDDHSTVVDEAWQLDDLFGPDICASASPTDSPIENLFGIPDDLFHFGLEAEYPPPRNENGEIVQFASVREALQSLGSQHQEYETNVTQSTSENRDFSASSTQPASILPAEQSRSVESPSGLARSGVSASSLHPVLPQDDHSPRRFREDSSSSSSCRAMFPPPPVPVIAIQPRRQFGLPHSIPSNHRNDLEQQHSVHVPPSLRPLHHPLSVPNMPSYPGHYPSTRTDEVLSMPLVQDCEEPAVLTLTSFPFRIICVNKAFSDLTGRSHELIGYSFYELFVSESDHAPSMATTPTLLGLFNNDIVRVIIKEESTRRARSSRTTSTSTTSTTNGWNNRVDPWVEFHDSDNSSSRSSNSSIGSIGVEDEEARNSDTFCMIRVEGIPCDGTNMQYFSIKLSPLQIPSSNTLALTNSNNNNNNNVVAFSSSSVIYLPMPCGGTGSGVPPLRPREC